MKRLNEQGVIDTFLVPLVIMLVLFVAAAAFAIWAYQGRQDYKNNVDQKVTTAVAVAKQQESTAKDKQFAEAQKSPLRAYNGPEAYGSIVINFPKTWSAYVDDTGSGSPVVDGYFAPGTVPSVTDQSSTFALRLQVLSQAYSQVLSSLPKATNVTVTPYSAPRVPGVVGVRLHGEIKDNKTGDMVILPLRDKTLELWTESSDSTGDFNNNILPNFSFSP